MPLAKRYILIWINITFLFISSHLAIATTLRVGPSGYPYTSVQAAIDDAVQGLDKVLVYDGIYRENINFNGKSITVRSAHGAFFTIIDGSFNGSVVTFCNHENPSTELKGFSIRNGLASLGGGIHCSNASPQITQCIIRNNTASEGCTFRKLYPKIKALPFVLKSIIELEKLCLKFWVRVDESVIY